MARLNPLIARAVSAQRQFAPPSTAFRGGQLQLGRETDAEAKAVTHHCHPERSELASGGGISRSGAGQHEIPPASG